MLLHNQRNAPISWEANGREYTWEPYGACNVPDVFVPLIKSEGFPVSVTPVPPVEKAARAADGATEDAKSAEITKLKKDLEGAVALAQESKAAAEAADIRATAVRAEADEAKAKVLVLDEELRSLRGDSAEYERMISEASGEISNLKEQLAKATPAPSKPKDK